MVAYRIDRQSDHLDPALVELRLQLGYGAQFGGADRGEILGVGEQNDPAVACPFIEIDHPFGRVLREVRRDIVDLKRHGWFPLGGTALAGHAILTGFSGRPKSGVDPAGSKKKRLSVSIANVTENRLQ